MKKIIVLVFCLLYFSNSYSQSGWFQQYYSPNIINGSTRIFFLDSQTGWLSYSENGYHGIVKTTNGGNNWNILDSTKDYITSIFFIDQNNGWMSTGNNPGGGNFGRIYNSVNAGLSWTQQIIPINESPVNDKGISHIKFLNSNTGFACGYILYLSGQALLVDTYVLKTINGGNNWSVLLRISTGDITNNPGWFQKLDFVDENNVWVSGNMGLFFYTTNGGVNWTQTFINNGGNFTDLKLINQSTGYVFSSFGGSITGWPCVLLKSTNGGANFSAVYSTNILKLFGFCFLDLNNGYVCGDSNIIMKTTNGGINWKTQNTPIVSSYNRIYFYNINTGWAIDYYGHILKTTTGGVADTITPKYFPLAVGNVYKYHFSSSAGIVYDHKTRITKDTIINSKKYFVVSGGFPGVSGGNIIRYDSLTGNTYYRNNGGYCSYSPFEVIIDSLASKKGDTTTRCTTPVLRFCSDTSNSSLFGIPVKSKTFRSNNSEGYETVTYSTSFGVANYFAQDFQAMGSDQLVGCYINGILYGDTSNILYTISGNVRYLDNNLPATNGYVKAFKLDNSTSNIIVFDSAQIQSDGSYILNNVPRDSLDIGVYPNSTTNNDWVITYYPSTTYWQGATTLYPTGNLTNINIGAIRLTATTNSNSVNGKVLRLTDAQTGNLKDAVLYAKNGNTFVRCGMSDGNGIYHLPSLPAGNLKIICNRFGFTNDSAMVNVTSTSNIDSINFHLYRIPVGIKQISSNVPSEYKLYQNYPNPFNPSTVIRFQIKDSRYTMIKVYNILGKEVTTLVNEKKSPGTYEVTFDRSGLASGMYFYTLISGDFKATKRFVLIK